MTGTAASAPPRPAGDAAAATRVVLPDGTRIEVARVGVDDPGAPLAVFLHEGLGSVALWRDVPARWCAAAGVRGLVWSRPGYGGSTPRAPHERWGTDFMHRQALEVLPAVLAACGVPPHERYALVGHSDGGSIALIHAAHHPARVRCAVVLAPHVFVEDVSVESIAKARDAYLHGGLRERLARFHDDVDSAFFGWADAWLSPAFRDWSLLDLLPSVRCPLLAIQGEDDEYGTMAQIDAIARAVPGTRVLAIPSCGHSPHRDASDTTADAVVRFLRDFSS